MQDQEQSGPEADAGGREPELPAPQNLVDHPGEARGIAEAAVERARTMGYPFAILHMTEATKAEVMEQNILEGLGGEGARVIPGPSADLIRKERGEEACEIIMISWHRPEVVVAKAAKTPRKAKKSKGPGNAGGSDAPGEAVADGRPDEASGAQGDAKRVKPAKTKKKEPGPRKVAGPGKVAPSKAPAKAAKTKSPRKKGGAGGA